MSNTTLQIGFWLLHKESPNDWWDLSPLKKDQSICDAPKTLFHQSYESVPGVKFNLKSHFQKTHFNIFLVANQYVFGRIFAILVYYYEIIFLFCFAKQTKVRMNSH